MTTPFKFRYVHEITGIFVLAIVALALLGLFLVGRSHRWFQETHVLRVALPSETPGGIRTGSEVRVIGTLVGVVRSIETRVGEDGGQVAVALAEIDDEMWRFVRHDSTAVIRKQFLVTGDAFIEITAGTGDPIGAEPLVATLARDPAVVLQESLLEMRDTVTRSLGEVSLLMNEYTELARDLRAPDGPMMRVLENTSDITHELKDPDGRLQQLLDRLAGLAEELRAPDGPLQTLLADAGSIAAGLEAGEGTAGRLLKDPSLAEATERAIREVDLAVQELRVILDDLQAAAARLPSMAEVAADELEQAPGTIFQARETMREVEALAEAIKRHWLISGYVEPDDPAAPIGSTDLDLPMKGGAP